MRTAGNAAYKNHKREFPSVSEVELLTPDTDKSVSKFRKQMHYRNASINLCIGKDSSQSITFRQLAGLSQVKVY